MAHLTIPETLSHAIKTNQSSYCIFGDLRTAFASLRRNVALMGENDGDEVWIRHLERCGFSQTDAAEIISLACSCLKWQAAGGTEHAFRIPCEAHRNTWFTTEGLNNAVRFVSGCTAGTPLADIIFCLGVTCSRCMIDKKLIARVLHSTLDVAGADSYF